MELNVSNCNNCLFCNYDNEFGRDCKLSEFINPDDIISDDSIPDYHDDISVPSKCPLLNTDIYIYMNEK